MNGSRGRALAAMLLVAVVSATLLVASGWWRPEARPDTDLRPGVAYRHRLWTHCALSSLELDGRRWVPATGFGTEVPDEWQPAVNADQFVDVVVTLDAGPPERIVASLNNRSVPFMPYRGNGLFGCV